MGSINLPIIKYSVDWWNTLASASQHQINWCQSIHASMMTPLMLMLLFYYYTVR